MWKSMRKWEVWESIPISHPFLLFLLPSPGAVVVLLLLPWGHMPQVVPVERPRGRTSHAANHSAAPAENCSKRIYPYHAGYQLIDSGSPYLKEFLSVTI